MATSRAQTGLDLYQCEGVTKAGAQCKRRLKRQTLCYQHAGGGSAGGFHAHPDAGQKPKSPVEHSRRPDGVHRPERARITAQAKRAKTLLASYRELSTSGWRETMADRLSAHLGDAIWAEVDREWKTRDCKKLAEAARELAAAGGHLTNLDAVLGRPGVKEAVACSSLASAMVSRVQGLDKQVASVVLSMRVTGIIVCEIHGRLGSCQCLKDLADEVVPNVLQAKLDGVCYGYLEQIG